MLVKKGDNSILETKIIYDIKNSSLFRYIHFMAFASSNITEVYIPNTLRGTLTSYKNRYPAGKS